MTDRLTQLRAERVDPDNPPSQLGQWCADMQARIKALEARHTGERLTTVTDRIRLDDRVATWRSANFPARSIQRLVEARYELAWPKDGYIARGMAAIRAGRAVIMLGDSGPGKTTMATELAYRYAIESGRSMRYEKAPDLVADFRHQCYGENKSSEGEWISRWTTKFHLLVIDEYDKRAESDKSADMILLRLLDKRYDALAPTVIVSNLNPKAWEAALDRSVKSRFSEWAETLVFDWPSFRTPTPAEK